EAVTQITSGTIKSNNTRTDKATATWARYAEGEVVACDGRISSVGLRVHLLACC
ncbi:hypothetical protein ACJX0J_029713, partial [Zea mays]